METTAEQGNELLVVSNNITHLIVSETAPEAAAKPDQPGDEPTEAPLVMQEENAEDPDAEPLPLQLNVIYRHVDELKEHPDAHRVPPMSTAQFQELFESISRGFRSEFPIYINPLGFILDGRHRWKAAQKKKTVWVPCLTMNVADEVDFIYSCALRRDLTEDQRSLLLLARLEHLSAGYRTERAKKAASAKKAESLLDNSSKKQPAPKHNARKEVAEEAGVPEHLLKKAKKFAEDFPDEIAAVLRGDKRISQIRAEAKKQDADSAKNARLAQAKKLVPLGDWLKGDGTKKVRPLPDASIRTVFIRTKDHAAVGEALKAAEATLLAECHIFVFVPNWREEHHFVKALEARRLSVNARLIWHRLDDKGITNGPVDTEEAILWATRGTPPLKDQRDSRPSVVLAYSPDFENGSGEPPVALIRDLLDYSTLVGESVLSPFGLPNCVIAARQRQRNVFAYEIDDANYAAGRLLIDRIFDQPSRTDAQIESALADPEPLVHATALPAELQLPTDNVSGAAMGEGA